MVGYILQLVNTCSNHTVDTFYTNSYNISSAFKHVIVFPPLLHLCRSDKPPDTAHFSLSMLRCFLTQAVRSFSNTIPYLYLKYATLGDDNYQFSKYIFYILYFIFYILYFIFYILYFIFYILYFIFYILYFIFYILYFIFYILYFLFFILYFIFYTHIFG